MVAVAGGPAFTFGYAETTELLAAAGAEVVTVDPLRDAALPPGTAGLVVGGGFPEVHASALAANVGLRTAIAELAAAGAPIAAECAGLLYLARTLDGEPMCGVLDAEAAMHPRLALGYRAAVALTDSVLAPAGTRVRGHEFHRTRTSPGAGPTPAWQWNAGSQEGFVAGSVHASYLHLNWAGSPGMASPVRRRGRPGARRRPLVTPLPGVGPPRWWWGWGRGPGPAPPRCWPPWTPSSRPVPG